MASADSIVAMLRQYQAQFGIKNCPIVLVYSVIAAASALLLCLSPVAAASELDQRLKFLLASLDECSATHDTAEEARSRFQQSLEKKSSELLPAQPERFPTPLLGEQVLNQEQHSSSPWTEWELSGATGLVDLPGSVFDGSSFAYGMSPLTHNFDPILFSTLESPQMGPWLDGLEMNDVGI